MGDREWEGHKFMGGLIGGRRESQGQFFEAFLNLL